MPAKTSKAKGAAKKPAPKPTTLKNAELQCQAKDLGHHGCKCPECLEGQRAP